MDHAGLAEGTIVAGKYVVERPLGRGGMGAVYVVSHASTGKRLAMKTLLSEFVGNADLVGRFLREAQVMGRVQHRHVVDVFDVGRDGDVLYIVMELLEGKPLSDLLHDSSLTLEEALIIMLRAMEGVSAAHAQGVVHRDLKPDNIFICVGTSGRLDDPRVLDFGISKLEDPAVDQLTRSGVSMGTPYYMSIEQLKGQRDLDQRVDVYALGVILYEAIAGTPPFVADSISALAIKVLTSEPVHLGALRPDLPAGLADVVMKALARERDDRHRSVRQLIEALRPFVPRSAGLSVPEGQGKLLRTPRGANAAQARSGASQAPVHARGTGGVLDAATQPSSQRSPRARPSAAKRLLWALPIVALAGGVAAVAHQLGIDTAGRSPTDPTVSGGSSPQGPMPPPIPLDPTTNVLQTPTRVAPTTTPQGPVVAPTTTTQTAPALEHKRKATAPTAAEPVVVPAVVPAVAEQPVTVRSPDGDVGPRGAATQPAARAAHHRSSKRAARASEGKPATRRPAATASEFGADAPSAQPTPPEPTPAAPPSIPRKSAEGRAGKLGSDEF